MSNQPPFPLAHKINRPEMRRAYMDGVKRDYGVDLPEAYVDEILGQVEKIMTLRTIQNLVNMHVWRLIKRGYEQGLAHFEEEADVEEFLEKYPRPYWEEGFGTNLGRLGNFPQDIPPDI